MAGMTRKIKAGEKAPSVTKRKNGKPVAKSGWKPSGKAAAKKKSMTGAGPRRDAKLSAAEKKALNKKKK